MSTVSGAILTILRDRGPRGFFTAVLPTTLRQSINASIKFSTYHKLTELARKRYDQEGKGLPTIVSSAIGSATGFVSAFTTQPLDVVKTRYDPWLFGRLSGRSNISNTVLIPRPSECSQSMLARFTAPHYDAFRSWYDRRDSWSFGPVYGIA